MTAPVTYTREQREEAAQVLEHIFVGAPDDRANEALLLAVEVLRQAAADGQGNDWKVARLQRAVRDARNLGLGLELERVLGVCASEPGPCWCGNHATPTTPTPPPAVGRCKTCKHFSNLQCINWNGVLGVVPTDGTGHCHNHEAAK